MGTSTIVRRYWCAEASPPSTTRLLGVSHRRGDRIRTCGLLYLLQLGGTGAFQVLYQAELHLYCPFYARAGDHPFSSPQLWQSHLLLRCGRLAMLFFALHLLHRTHWGLRPPSDDDDAICHAIATPYGVGCEWAGISTFYTRPFSRVKMDYSK